MVLEILVVLGAWAYVCSGAFACCLWKLYGAAVWDSLVQIPVCLCVWKHRREKKEW